MIFLFFRSTKCRKIRGNVLTPAPLCGIVFFSCRHTGGQLCCRLLPWPRFAPPDSGSISRALDGCSACVFDKRKSASTFVYVSERGASQSWWFFDSQPRARHRPLPTILPRLHATQELDTLARTNKVDGQPSPPPARLASIPDGA